MLNFYMLSSGSRGNSTIIWDENDLIIIDCGISLKKFSEKTSELGIENLEKSIFISHEHSDHSSGARAISRKLKADVYSRNKTLDKIRLDRGYGINGEVAIGNFTIMPVSVNHDAVDPVVYVIRNRGIKISVVSDLGIMNGELLDAMQGSDIMAIEANHDPEMLRTGPYTEMLKMRIRSDHGHLSNEQTAEAIYESASDNTRIVLTHLSEKNNTPDIALETVKAYLSNRNKKYISIEAASQDFGSTLYRF
ncbi:MBL fold metallo-hydrolase [Ferroplasma sp.]|jgi:phosphoribosyl 1,2-cyclic phosphodiesterase|uniref:MBL fold metallo-hydrolase n=1 Tax=Ferroplasma sp. TaxID=2591003 RepID=UPI002627483B|nr:MBL fold metallo-hydrolase [Ferroplasma sp.]